MNKQIILDATKFAINLIHNKRFFNTERGYQGALFCHLHQYLLEKGLISEDVILEMEYQKSTRHNVTQRPDIILHIPVEISGADIHENNFAVWALKRESSSNKAREDFSKLDIMFGELNYPIGIFINISAQETMLEEYKGNFKDRIYAFSIHRGDNGLLIKMANFEDGKVIEHEISNR